VYFRNGRRSYVNLFVLSPFAITAVTAVRE